MVKTKFNKPSTKKRFGRPDIPELPDIEEAPEGLVPIGDAGLYITPDEPADPRDCNRYPDSPYCGGNPFTLTPVALETTLVIDECNLGITLSPTLGFVKLPPVTIVYRKPECREPEPKPIEYEEVQLETKAGWYIEHLSFEDKYVRQIIKAEKMPGVYIYDNGYIVECWKVFFLDCKGNTEQWTNVVFYDAVSGESLPYFELQTCTLGDGFVIRGEIVHVERCLIIPYGLTPYHRLKYQSEAPLECYPIQPPPFKDICCMPQCCPPIDNTLLKLLIKKVDKLSQIVGVDEYPVSVPRSFISKDEGWLGNLIPNPNAEIVNITQFIAWYVERFDEIMGQFEIPIEVKDSDPTKPGDQPVGFKLPNVAESIAEMMGLILQISINSETVLNLATRSLLESGQDKQQNFITYKLLQTLTDYLGYSYKEKRVELPLLFTPEKTKYDELLQETKIKVTVPEFDEKLNFQADLMRFRKAASILDSVYFRKVNPNGDIKAQLMDNLRKLRKDLKDLQDIEDDGFKKFLNEAEEGFVHTPGVTDATHPYGRSYDQRPRIKDLTPDTNQNQP